MHIFGKTFFFKLLVEKSVFRLKFGFSPKRKVLAQNKPQKSIPGVKNCRYRHLSCIYLETIFFCNFNQRPKLGVAPSTTQHHFFQFFLRDSVCITIMNIFHHKLAFLLIVYQKMPHCLY